MKMKMALDDDDGGDSGRDSVTSTPMISPLMPKDDPWDDKTAEMERSDEVL